MIHFDVTETDGDRELRIEGTDTLVGWIERGRTRIDQYGNPKTEFRFVPADPAAPAGKVYFGRGISPAYDDARAYAATLTGVQS